MQVDLKIILTKRKSSSLRYVFLFLSILIARISFAQSTITNNAQEKYRAVHWGLQDGLSQACVLQMRKDVKGFLWMGTQGALSRFDGSVFKNFYHDLKKSGTINAKYTALGLVEDSLHNIWIGTNNGLYRYDIKADTFTRFMQGVPLLATRDELFCGGSDGFIITYNIHTLVKKTVATLTPADSVGAGSNIFSTFFDERSNSLWMLRSIRDNNGWHGSGLLQISLTTGVKKYYDWNCYKNIPGHDHSAEGMCYDQKRNCFWINSGEGLMQFTLDDHQFHYTGALNDFFKAKDYYRWVGICMDLEGRVWLATMPKGIVIYDPSSHSVEFPFAEGSALQKEISDNNGVLYCDRDGIIWSGFWIGKGLYQIIPFAPSFTHYRTDTSTNSFHIGTIYNFQNAGQGKMWIGSTDGFRRIFNTHTGNYQTLSENDLPPDLRRTWIIPLMIDTIASKAYLFCFDKGLWVLDINTNKCKRLIFKNSTNQEVTISVQLGSAPFKNGFLVSGIQDNRQCIFFVNGDSMVVHESLSFPVNPGNAFNLAMADDRFMFLRGSGATGNMTYSWHNNTWMHSPHPLDSIPLSHIVYNSKDQGYWVVAEKELIHYSKDFKLIHVYTPKDGLPELDIYSLLPDSKGHIWFNTDRSIHQLNTETGVFSTLSEKDGYKSQNFSQGAYISMGADGDLYLGEGAEGEGFVRISPDKYTNTSSSVYLQSLEINQKPFPLSTGINNLQELSLRYFENMITIETGIIDYYAKGKGNIRYKLEAEGKTSDWQYAPAYYTIRYENLSPGKYKLVMQASNAANEFNGPEKNLNIIISPPWWTTWWAYLLYALTFASLVWGFIQYRSKKLRERNIVLEEKVMHRTKELKHSLEDLRATQAQLIQSEKMASLGELTAGIAHEIQNPLNFVNNFSEVSTELVDEMNTELDKGNIADAKEIAGDLKQNLEKINHHGKRAGDIVKGMLQHSQASTGQKEPTDINNLADEYLRLSYHGLRSKSNAFNATLKTDYDKSISNINIIPQDIGRVLLNLYNNAFYTLTEKGKEKTDGYEPTISVTTKKINGKVEISVKDNGKGIPQKAVDKIFQPFFTTKPTGQGTGLGLSLSYDIIKAHGGEIKVETKESEGSEFTIQLPIYS
jgi:signal transduction histidine kinase/ligand-binding sensor domain-containing protein